MTDGENKDFSIINTTTEDNHIYEDILEDYSQIENPSRKNPQDQQYDNLGALVVAKPKKKSSYGLLLL